MLLEDQLRNLLKLAIETSELSIQEIAERVGLTRQSVYNLLNGGGMQISTVDSILSVCGAKPVVVPNMAANLEPELMSIETLILENLSNFDVKKIQNFHIRTNRIYDLQFFGFSNGAEPLIEATEEYRKLYSDMKTSVNYDQSLTPCG